MDWFWRWTFSLAGMGGCCGFGGLLKSMMTGVKAERCGEWFVGLLVSGKGW